MLFLNLVSKSPCAWLSTATVSATAPKLAELLDVSRHNTGTAGRGEWWIHPYSCGKKANALRRGLRNAGWHITVEGHCTKLWQADRVHGLRGNSVLLGTQHTAKFGGQEGVLYKGIWSLRAVTKSPNHYSHLDELTGFWMAGAGGKAGPM